MAYICNSIPSRKGYTHEIRQDGKLLAVAAGSKHARLMAASPEMLQALKGCAEALKEAGKDFALSNPHAARPNMYETHETNVRALITSVEGI